MFSLEVKKILNGCANPFGARTRYPDPLGNNSFDSDDFESDEFRMYSFKIKKCPINRTHDWTVCPYAHRGERARRRDPRRLPYVALACPEFRATGGVCPRGELCPYAHGVFEYWLHPAKYRTRVCTAGEHCTRPVCFFAHSPEELRPEQPGHLSKWARLALRMDAEARTDRPAYIGASSSNSGPVSSVTSHNNLALLDRSPSGTSANSPKELPLEFFESLMRLRINEYYNNINKSNNVDEYTPNIDWVSDLLAG